MKLSCVVVDDEPLALDIIEDYIRKIPFLIHVESFSNPLEALEFLRSNKTDVLFLDIQMEDLTGIQLIKVLPKKPFVILTTAYERYALQGYELDVADYLLKPISFDRFVMAVNKVYDRVAEINKTSDTKSDNITITNATYDYFFFRANSKMIKVNFPDILYIEGQGDYLRIVTPREKIMTLQSFKKMEEILPTDNFLRVHKSFIIAIDKIHAVERNRIIISDKAIPVSETYKNQLHQILNERGGG